MATNYMELKNNELHTLLHQRSLEAVLGDDGKLIRQIAVDKLKKWDAENEETPTRMCRAVFHKTGDEAALPYVFLALNGKTYQAPYDKEVVIPEHVLKACCDNAKRTTYRMDGIDKETGLVKYRKDTIHTQPYTILGYVEEEEN